MRFLKFNSRSLTLISILLMAAFIGTSVMGATSVQAATTPVAPVGDGTSVSVAYTIYKDGSGYTCAKSSATGSIDFRNTNSKWVIQKTIDKLSGGYILINAGTYDISQTIYTNKVSIIGQGNSTVLKATTGCSGAVIRVCNDYWTLDNRYMSSPPNGITIANLAVDGNRAVRTSGLLEGVAFLSATNSKMVRLYVHDLIGGQGLYMSNSQYCTISRCQTVNIGDNSAAHYGSGIAFGTASNVKTASSHITIDRCYISGATMSSIDLEPANNVAITNCVFRNAMTWKGYYTPVITMYQVSGYVQNNYVTVSGCNVNGGFNEFVVFTPSSHSVVKNNVVTYTRGSCTAIYATNSNNNVITGNVIKTSSSQPIHLVGCSSCTVSGNTILAR